MRRALFLASVVFSFALFRCVSDDSSGGPDSGGDGNGSDATTGDAGTNDAPNAQDVQEEPPASGFTLSLSPAHVTADVNDTGIVVTLNVLRASGFTADVSFSVTPPTGVTASAAPDTGNNGNSSSFTLSVGAGAQMGDADVAVTAQDPNKNFVQTQHLAMRIGSALDVSSGTVTIPSFASSVTVKAWGAGGGSAFTYAGDKSSVGGAGGYATVVLNVTSGEQLAAHVGTGGGGVLNSGSGEGAGGGGYTALCPTDAGTCLVIAAGGGGGAGGGNTTGDTGGAGGAGGGATGDPGGTDTPGGYVATPTGGTQSGGGNAASGNASGTNGTALQGGAGGGSASTAGGSPGGGKGGSNCGGGGGGGYYGGGGGAGTINASQYYGSGGGGGSSYAPSGTVTKGSGATPPAVDSRCASGAAAGGVGGASGGAGCLLVLLPKP